jgi:hypothetical protein
MFQLPENMEQYKDSYIFCQNKNEMILHYIKVDGEVEPVNINNPDEFLTKIDKIRPDKKSPKLNLTEDQIMDLITSKRPQLS